MPFGNGKTEIVEQWTGEQEAGKSEKGKKVRKVRRCPRKAGHYPGTPAYGG